MTEGSRMDTAALTKQFKSECHDAVCHDMVVVEGIHQVGLCEHHLLPILMSITIRHVPDKKILGLSKLARIAGYFSHRLQNQERTAHLVADFVENTVEPLGVAVLVDGKHLCAMARGVRDTHSTMKVNVMHGSVSEQSGYPQGIPPEAGEVITGLPGGWPRVSPPEPLDGDRRTQ